MIRLWALVFVTLYALSCHAEEACPWLNSATASGVLGGAVTSVVTHESKNKDDATCEYTSKTGAFTEALRITVNTMANRQRDFARYISQCGPSSTSMRAIGNEAVACTYRKNDGEQGEQIISRVRDRAFWVRVTTNSTLAMHESLREQARNVAEQVAGFLF